MSDILITGDGKFPMDVQVPIVSAQTTADGRTVIVAQGKHRGRSVGVELSVLGQMKPGIVGDDIDKTAFYVSGVLVRSRGDAYSTPRRLFSEVYILPNRYCGTASAA